MGLVCFGRRGPDCLWPCVLATICEHFWGTWLPGMCLFLYTIGKSMQRRSIYGGLMSKWVDFDERLFCTTRFGANHDVFWTGWLEDWWWTGSSRNMLNVRRIAIESDYLTARIVLDVILIVLVAADCDEAKMLKFRMDLRWEVVKDRWLWCITKL